MHLSELEQETAKGIILEAVTAYLKTPRGEALVRRVAAEMGVA